MFYSLRNSFSIQTVNPASGSKMPWLPITDEVALLDYLSRLGRDTIFRIAGMDYTSNAVMMTHKYCERMLWGNEAFGTGVKI